MTLDELKWDNVTEPVHLGAQAAAVETSDMQVVVYRSCEGFYSIDRGDRRTGHWLAWHGVTREHAEAILIEHCSKTHSQPETT